LAASFQIEEDAPLDRADPMPDAPDPDTLPTERERLAAFKGPVDKRDLEWMTQESAIEIRHVDQTQYLVQEDKETRNLVWMRTTAPVASDDRLLHQSLIAYASDMTLIDTAMRPHLASLAKAELQVASLDHAMWFHRPARADEWLLYVQNSPSMSSSRGLTNAVLHRQNGELAVSVVQEGLVRVRGSRSDEG
jgi:acyl-CoA thioesterase-2